MRLHLSNRKAGIGYASHQCVSIPANLNLDFESASVECVESPSDACCSFPDASLECVCTCRIVRPGSAAHLTSAFAFRRISIWLWAAHPWNAPVSLESQG